MLKTLDLLKGFRYPLAIQEVHSLVCEATGENWHPRTTRRDLYFLEVAGYVDAVPTGVPNVVNFVAAKQIGGVA